MRTIELTNDEINAIIGFIDAEIDCNDYENLDDTLKTLLNKLNQ